MDEPLPIVATGMGGALLVALTLAGIWLFPGHAGMAAGGGAAIGCALNMAIQFALLPRLDVDAATRRKAAMRKIYWPAGN